ncbi:MAG TPA: GUN4 domain-containing protein, partial [Thermosynechococcaceae cyanobacterium]
MANSWAVVVGINHYEHLPQDDEHQLRCAVSDAERMQDFLCQQAGFDSENVFLCTDDSPAISGLNTRPSRTNLRRLLLELHKRPQAMGADVVWFFYSGHGISQEGQDYLLMQDGYPGDLAETAVSLRFVMEKLIQCRAKTTVLVLDMCRNSVTSAGKGGEATVGMQTIQEAQQQGIITLFSCSRGGRSYELPELKQGVFTHALLEGLGKHSLPGQLGDYLRQRVYELTQHHRPIQVPLIALEPDWRYNLPLLATCVTKTDINHLKERAIHAFADEDFGLAKQLWEQVNDLATDAEDRKLSRQMLLASDRKRTLPNAALPNFPSSDVFGIAETLPISTAPKVELLPVEVQSAPARPKESDDDLSLEKELDYGELEELLKNERWREADSKTCDLMHQAINESQIQVKHLKNYPCEVLESLDFLWTKYSDGKFGFSAQARIWKELNSDDDAFDVQVGWRLATSKRQRNPNRLIFNLNDAPPGHLPAFFKSWGGGGWSWKGYILSRAEACGLPCLPSERGVDYRKLRDLLKAGKWKEADEETLTVMCQATSRQKEGWLRPQDIQVFPCTDLQTIDQLWVKYSNGCFGFSIQKRIWQKSGSPKSPGKDWDLFCGRVGWVNQETSVYMDYSDLKCDLAKSPAGELPVGTRIGSIVWLIEAGSGVLLFSV